MYNLIDENLAIENLINWKLNMLNIVKKTQSKKQLFHSEIGIVFLVVNN